MAKNILKELKQIQANNSVPQLNEEQAQQSVPPIASQNANQNMEAMFKNYRHMSYNDKSKVLIDQNEIDKIEKMLAK